MVVDFRNQKDKQTRPPSYRKPKSWWKIKFPCLDFDDDHDAIWRYRSKAHLSNGKYTKPANSFAGGTTGGSGAGGC